MFENKQLMKVEALLDGETQYAAGAEEILVRDPKAAAHLEAMRHLRGALELRPSVPVIADAQFSAFMAGIRDQIEAPAAASGGAHRSWWAMASLAAASLLVAASALYIFSGGPEPVRASEVESVSTDIAGATTGYEYAPDGNTTVWIEIAEDDL